MSLEHKEIIPKGKPEKKHYLTEIREHIDSVFTFRKNMLTLELEVASSDKPKFKPLDERFLNSLWLNLQLNGFKCSENILLKLLNSELTQEYNPLKDYFDNLPEHDGRDYIGELVNTIQISSIESEGVNLQGLWKPFLTKWLLAAAATATGKGINHTCLILVGGQGTGKTTWLNNLCPSSMKDYLVCSHINPTLTDQNTANFLAEKFIVNIDDQLETIFGKDFNSMKAIITAPAVTNRKTWHRLTRKRARICSFVGSVNNPKFLTDSENRRYLVFTVDQINFNHNVNMDKVWGQAIQMVNDNIPYWLNQAEIKQINKINEIYRQIPPEEEWLIKLFEPCTPEDPRVAFLMPSEMLSLINANSGLRLSNVRLSRAITKLKYHKKISKRINGQPRHVYPVIRRTETDEQELQKEFREL